MTDNAPDSTNQATITITFYFGQGDSSPYLLSKKYLVKNWQTEADLRRIVDEIAGEMNYISGYGILSIAIASEHLNFTLNYKDQLKPYKHGEIPERYHDFKHLLRFEVGYYTGWRRGPIRLEIPRFYWTGFSNPLVKYDPNDKLFQIKAVTVGGRKKIRQSGTIYHLYYDPDNPILNSFLTKIRANGVLIPNITRPWRHHQNNYVGISWWELPEAQWSWTKWEKQRKQEEKKKKQEEKKQKQLEKTGIVYKDKKATKKAHQVYIIQLVDSETPDIYKIGISNAPGKRLQSLSTSIPHELKVVHHFVADPAKEAEANLHQKFKEARLKGEWFRLTSEQIDELKQIVEYKNGKFIKSDKYSDNTA